MFDNLTLSRILLSLEYRVDLRDKQYYHDHSYKNHQNYHFTEYSLTSK